MTNSWTAGWATNDIVSATELAKGVGSIYDTTLGASAATIDINPPIPTSYAHLRIVVYARSDAAVTDDYINMRFNNDSAANYDDEGFTATGASPTSSENLAATSIRALRLPGASAGANLFGGGEIVVPHYAGAANNKFCFSLGSAKWGTATGNVRLWADAGHWRSNAAITRVTLLPNSGNFVSGTRVTVYVMGA